MIRHGQFSEETAGKIKKLRKERGWTQERLAEEIRGYGWRQVRQQDVTRVECMLTPITVDDLIAFSFAFDVHVKDLLP